MDTYVFWGVIFFLASAVFSGAIQYHFVRDTWRTMPLATHISLVVSIFICLLPFPLLTIDVDAALSAVDQGLSASSASNWIRVWWFIVFFGTQIMAWGVLPIAQEYDCAGQFTPAEKFKHSVRENIRLYLILGVVAGLLMAYVFFVKGIYTISGMIAMIMAISNAFGLIVLVIFFSCGLIGVPRRLWHLSSASKVLAESYRKCQQFHEELDINKTEIVFLRAEIGRRATDASVNQNHLTMMLDDISTLEHTIPLGNTTITDHNSEANLKSMSLVQLNAELRRLAKMIRRQFNQYRAALRTCVRLEGVVSGAETSFYWTVVRQPLLKALAAASAIMTCLVMWSEAVVPLSYLSSTNMSILQLVVSNPNSRFIGSVGFIYYMAGCCFWAVFRFRVFDLYELVPRVSDGASMCFIATFVTRVILPLCYNFLFLANLTSGHTLVTYSQIFGNMDVVEFLGAWFNRFMPIFIPILATLIELGVIHRLMQMIGIEGFETGEESATRNLQMEEAGRALVVRENGGELRAVGSTTPPPVTPPATNAAAVGPRASEKYEKWKAERRAKEVAGGAS